LSSTGEARQRRALRLIAASFIALAGYLLAQTGVVLAAAYHPRHSSLAIAWTALTVVIMFALAAGKRRSGRGLGNKVLLTESRVTVIDGLLAGAVLGVLLNSAVGWWWADPAAGLIIVYWAIREARTIYAMRETGALADAPAEVVTPGRVGDSACCGSVVALPGLGGDLAGVPR
jgi:divalent metal cation (Fe/Co/Zn/Cd) transporter